MHANKSWHVWNYALIFRHFTTAFYVLYCLVFLSISLCWSQKHISNTDRHICKHAQTNTWENDSSILKYDQRRDLVTRQQWAGVVECAFLFVWAELHEHVCCFIYGFLLKMLIFKGGNRCLSRIFNNYYWCFCDKLRQILFLTVATTNIAAQSVTSLTHLVENGNVKTDKIWLESPMAKKFIGQSKVYGEPVQKQMVSLFYIVKQHLECL